MKNRFDLTRPGLRSRLGLIALSSVALAITMQGAVQFDHVFSPQEGLTKAPEKPWRDEICLNGSWQFQPVSLPDGYDVANGAPLLRMPSADAWEKTPIRIPSPWNVNKRSRYHWRGSATKTFDYPDSWDDALMGWMRRDFTVPAAWADKRVVLHFEAITGFAQVFVNGEEVAQHFDNSLPFEVDVTDFLDPKSTNTVMVGVRAPQLFDVPGRFGKDTYPAGSGWNMNMVGIWQDVYVRALPALHVEDVAVRPLVDQGALELAVTVRNSSGAPHAFSLGGSVKPWINLAGDSMVEAVDRKWRLGDTSVTLPAVEAEIGPRTTTTLTLRRAIDGELKFWTPETPNLYAALLDITEGDTQVDRRYQRFGWRQWGIDGRDVTLNGSPYQLRADSGHLGGVPYLTIRYAYSWYRAIKDVNGNAIRLHATIRPRFYLDLADEMGIAILDESDIWSSSMEFNYLDPVTWMRFREHVLGMVERDRNHASVFGWSIANEVLSALWWKGNPRRTWPPVLDKFVALADEVKQFDPTRDWISSDGDGDFHGRLPTYIYHYGKPADWNRQAPPDKPFGIGEGGSMVWGSPEVFSAYNGERSYESAEGMSEGIAIELYWYLTEQRKISAFCSIFTIAGSCFERMELGGGEGVAFGPYVEGQPGMQPARLPSMTTFNPGFDPDLPFYQTTPVFAAIKAAYAPDGPEPCAWDHRVVSPERPKPPEPTIDAVAFVGSDDGALTHMLTSSGIASSPTAKGGVLVIDGASLAETDVPGTRSRMKATLASGGTVFVWASPSQLGALKQILPAKLELTGAHSQQLYADRAAPETAPIALADLYFAGESDPVILRHGLSGPLVEQGSVLMRANDYGRRRAYLGLGPAPKSPALVKLETGGGRLLVTSLEPDVRSPRRREMVRELFANLGVELGAPVDDYDTGFDGAGFLNQALVIGDFQGALYPRILDKDFIGGEAKANPSPGDQVGGRAWALKRSSGSGAFDFFHLGLSGVSGARATVENTVNAELRPEALDANNYLEVIERVSGTNPGTNSAVYLSFWIQAPRDLSADELTLQLRSDDGVKLWRDGDLVYEERRIYGPGMTDPKPVPMALAKGWNHLLLKVGQLDGPWLFSGRFESNDPDVPALLRASAIQPQ